MGKSALQSVIDLIDSVPPAKLEHLSTAPHQPSLWVDMKGNNIRIDMQGMADGGKTYNIQVQVNKNPSISGLKRAAGMSIAMYRAPHGKDEQSGSVIIAELIKDLMDNRDFEKYGKAQRAAQKSVKAKQAPTNTAEKEKDNTTETTESKGSTPGDEKAATTGKQSGKVAKPGAAGGKFGATGGKGRAASGKGARKNPSRCGATALHPSPANAHHPPYRDDFQCAIDIGIRRQCRAATTPLSARHATQTDKAVAERAQYIRRMRFAAGGLVLCTLGMYAAVVWFDPPPIEASGGSKPKAEEGSSRVIHNDSSAALPEVGVLEQAELVPTGTSTIPFFPRTVHLSENTATPETAPTPSLPAGTTPPPASPGTLVPPTDNDPATGGTEYQLLGLGIRTVSFLSIQVYVVGLYVASADIAKLQERLIRTVDPVATTLVAGEMQKLRSVLLDPVKSEEVWNEILRDGAIRTAFRIVPTRNTDFMHMRDGFVRGITARVNTIGLGESGSTPEAEERFGSAMNEFKAVFGGGSRKKIPYGQALYLLRNAQGQFEALVEDKKSGVREVMGTVTDERVSRLLWLNYLAGKNVSSEDARKSVVEGAIEWTSRPVGTVATKVV
ncbi:Altered inheritance of mitochondria protein 18, mitochondrial [Cyphellophora attinorum]|uniref:Altered inheritance of mitochondria protein 18, mitochondrial n=1 Tax=Cyphellophora attinorum TaxID=1664694 RepID=A0A0N1P1G3_9EURO|nr:Altered inheritance of mitochondria protein 18, mitochondrial [Phialophora attinorum]KPI44340.1 Altered inheritance of mitochondria protein 18, mitochondrial [Phialophora attinorum]